MLDEKIKSCLSISPSKQYLRTHSKTKISSNSENDFIENAIVIISVKVNHVVRPNSINLRDDAENYWKYEKFTDQMLQMATSINIDLINKPLHSFNKKIGIWSKED